MELDELENELSEIGIKSALELRDVHNYFYEYKAKNGCMVLLPREMDIILYCSTVRNEVCSQCAKDGVTHWCYRCGKAAHYKCFTGLKEQKPAFLCWECKNQIRISYTGELATKSSKISTKSLKWTKTRKSVKNAKKN